MKAFILAAGKGERLRPLTNQCPKPMLKVWDKPILEHVLLELEKLSFEKVVLNAWYLKDQIIDYVDKNSSKFSFEIKLSEEEDLLGTGGGLKQAMSELGEPPFLVLNADCLWSGDLRAFIRRAEEFQSSEAAWLLTEKREDQTPVGLFDFEICQIGSLWKAKEPQEWSCFTGIQWIRSLNQDELPNKGCLVRDYWIPRLKSGSKILGLKGFLGFWEDLGTPERLRQVDEKHSRLP